VDGLLAATDTRDWAVVLVLAAIGGVVLGARLLGTSWARQRAVLAVGFVALAWLALLALGLLAVASLEDDSGTVVVMAVIAAIASYGAIVSRLFLLNRDTSRWLPARFRPASAPRRDEPASEDAVETPEQPERYELYDDVVVATDRFEEHGVTRGTEGVVFGIGENGGYEIAVAREDAEPARFAAFAEDLVPVVQPEPEPEPEQAPEPESV
jgi:hypothetical protein